MVKTTNQAPFTVGHCAICGTRVLTYVDLNDDGMLVHGCLRCGAALHDDLQSVSQDQLAEHGYEIAVASSCGSGGSGGCGSCGVKSAPVATH